MGSLARRYARALMAIGIEARSYEALGREVERLARAYSEHAELREALRNPLFPLSQRKRVLEEVCRRLAVSRTVLHLALLLLERGRIDFLPDIARKLRELVDAEAGRVRARVTAVRPLDIATEVRIKTALEKLTGRTVVLDKREDPSILGGIVTQIGDVVYDGSVLTRLASLRQHIVGQ
ncbi:MAG: ATP synthase F1 subunit delta [Myxococcales bacterium]|nr:ATP synthase F1 subunit delta [Myxococcota bacterium]MDW8280544.1 ATP synthase F1 subunit delta [Myxococcales bacterium]